MYIYRKLLFTLREREREGCHGLLKLESDGHHIFYVRDTTVYIDRETWPNFLASVDMPKGWLEAFWEA
jgi:hypothetical protein